MMMDKRIRDACMLLTCGMVVAATACSDDNPTKPRGSAQEVSAVCNAQTLEADLDDDPPVGPGVDPATGTLQLEPGVTYIVSSTYGVPKRDETGAPTAHYQQLFGAVARQLEEESGLVSLQLGGSDACRSGRTLAVWRSEEDMLRFVTSPAHLAAMRDADEVLEPGYEVAHWTITGGDPVGWKQAVEAIGRSL